MSEHAQAETKEFAFQAEVNRLLDLLAHSLYQSKEIALRELVSNAADALDKMRRLSLTDESFKAVSDFAIDIAIDKDNGLLTITDNGIGMTRDELVDNLGTIAKSGSLEFLKSAAKDSQADFSLIGRFGVGFYSAFMLAERVVVETKSGRDDASAPGWRWSSEGTGKFSVEPIAEKTERGTSVILHLKSDVKAEFTEPKNIRRMVAQYSGFIPHPITIAGERVNKVRPIWVEPKSQISDEDYLNLYKYITHTDADAPLWHLHVSADVPIQFHAVLFCPPHNPEQLGFVRLDQGLNLCAKRVLVQHECKELLPEYLRFIVGIVDAEDLPLNISRETLQDNLLLKKIRVTLVRRVLEKLIEFSEKSDDYRKFYDQFSGILKEGFHEERDSENRKRLARLLRFASTASDDPAALVGFDDYLARAKEPTAIYYLGGADFAALKTSPHLEAFRKREIEVLLPSQPIDEFVLNTLGDYDGKKLVSADSADLELSEIEESPEEKEPPTAGLERVLALFRTALAGKVKDVRESKRLSQSPCVLTTDAGTSARMQHIIKQAQGTSPFAQSRILEVNPRAPLIKRLAMLSTNPERDEFIQDCGKLLFDNAMVLEGMLEDPKATADRIQRIMETAANGMSSIILT